MRLIWVFLTCVLFLNGCSSVYYDAMEKVGIPKRKILVDRVETARGAQQEAKEQFTSALEQFLAVTKVPATELQSTYKKLDAEFKLSESRAKEVRSRISAIDSVAQALFEEWNEDPRSKLRGICNKPSWRILWAGCPHPADFRFRTACLAG